MVPSTPLLDIKLYPILFNLDIVARTTFSFIALLLISLVSPTAILFNVSAGDIFLITIVLIFSIIFVCYFIFLYVCERCHLATLLISLFINSIAKIDIVGNIATI